MHTKPESLDRTRRNEVRAVPNMHDAYNDAKRPPMSVEPNDLGISKVGIRM
jgi:hypothetical protein